MNIFFAKDLKQKLSEKISSEIKTLKDSGTNPRIDLIIVGNSEDAISYANVKKKVGESLGITINIEHFDETQTNTDKLHEIIIKKNNNPKIHGIILESPFPKDIDFDFLSESVVYFKDLDGLNSKNIGFLVKNQEKGGLISATPLACLEILQNIAGDIKGLDITIVGNGRTVGKPLSQLLLNHGATVTSCHIDTKDIQKHCQNADVIIAAAGCPNLIKADFVNKNQIIIDVGTNFAEGKLVGDVDFENVKDKVKTITPVPGGVGPITTMKIFENLIKAIKLQQNFDHFDISLNDHIKISNSADLPGGGAIAMLEAIYGISMINMVLKLTKQNPERITELENRLQKNTEFLKKLYREDINIYNSFLEVLKLPKETEEQKDFRKHKIQKLSVKACEIPLNGIKLCINSIEIGKEILGFSTSSAIGDIYVGINMLTSSIKSLRGLVDGNKKSIKNTDYLSKLDEFEMKIRDFL